MEDQEPMTHDDQIEFDKQQAYESWLNDQPTHIIKLLELNDTMTIEEALEYLNARES